MNAPHFLWLFPLILLYWWLSQKEKLQIGTISTFFLWDFVLSNTASSKRSRAKPLWQTLGLTAILLALTEPILFLPRPEASICILLDTSLSMKTKDQGESQTRFERAQNWLKQQSFPSGQIICFPGGQIQRLTPEILSKNCTDGTFFDHEVIEAIETFKKQNPQGKTLWISDHALEIPSTLLDQQLLFGSPTSDNAGIVSARVRGYSEENALAIQIQHWGTTTQKRVLVVALGKEEIWREALLLPPAEIREKLKQPGRISREIPFHSRLEPIFITLEASDSLEPDNQRILNPRIPYRIYCDPSLSGLQAFLQKFPFLQFVNSAVESQVAIGLKKTEAPWTLLIRKPENESLWKYESVDSSIRLDWQKEDFILEGIALVGKSLYGGFRILKAPQKFISLASVDSCSVVGEYKESNQGITLWGIPLAQNMQDLELGLYLCNLLEREYPGSPLWSHFDTEPISLSIAETNNLGELRQEALSLNEFAQKQEPVLLSPLLIALAGLFFVLGWIHEEQGSFFFRKKRGLK